MKNSILHLIADFVYLAFLMKINSISFFFRTTGIAMLIIKGFSSNNADVGKYINQRKRSFLWAYNEYFFWNFQTKKAERNLYEIQMVVSKITHAYTRTYFPNFTLHEFSVDAYRLIF